MRIQVGFYKDLIEVFNEMVLVFLIEMSLDFNLKLVTWISCGLS